MSDYTPTTEEVKNGFIEFENAFRDLEEVESGFDRWLIEHDREVKAEAFDEGAKCEAYASATSKDSFPEKPKAINPYRGENW